MEPFIGPGLTAIAACIVAVITYRGTKAVESAKEAAAETTADVEYTSVQMQGWDRLYRGVRDELDRTKATLDAERALYDDLDKKWRAEMERRARRDEILKELGVTVDD